MHDLCLICVELSSNFGHSLKYVLLMSSYRSTIPPKFCCYINLSPLVNNSSPGNQFIIAVEGRFINSGFQLRAQKFI